MEMFFNNPLATVGQVVEWKQKQAEDTMTPITTYDQALDAAYFWAKSEPRTANKNAARVYIESMPLAEDEGMQHYKSIAKGRAMQLAYILGNLQGWRGEKAREAKVILKKQHEQDRGY